VNNSHLIWFNPGMATHKMSFLEVDNDGEPAVSKARGKLEVLMVYEDLSTGLRARQAFEQLAQQLEFDTDFRLDLWKFDLLREPTLLERAASEAAKSDIVILSAHGQHELPRTTHMWLEQWLERRSGQPCALVILLDALFSGTAASNRTWEALRAAALTAGMDVFLHPAEAVPAERPSNLDQIRLEHETRAATPADFLRGAEPHPYRHWGINE
jgi:hypothetical protein